MLPLWVRTAGLWLFPPLAFACAFGTARLAMALAHGRVQGDAHWTEQARQLYPRRLAFSLSFWAQLGCWCLVATFFGWHGEGGSTPASAILCCAAVTVGTTLAGTYASRGSALPGHPLRARLADLFTSLILRMLHLFLWLLIALTWSDHPWIMAAAAVLALFAVWRGAGLQLARALGLIRPASARLQAIVARAAASTGVTPKGVFEARMVLTNAFALIGGGKIVFTEGALANLTDGELESVAAHELGHLAEPRRLTLLRFAPLLLLAAVVVIGRSIDFETWTQVAMLWAGLVICILLVGRVSRAIARRGETHADAVAHRAETAADRGGYAKALEKIYRLNLMPAVLAKGTHPALYDRMLAAGVQPDYPRPAPPARARTRAALGAAVLLSAGPFAALATAHVYLRARPPDGERAALIALALLGADADLLSAVARGAAARADYSNSAALYAAAAEDRPRQPIYPAYQARMLIYAKRCPEAAAALRESQARLTEHSSKRVRKEVDETATKVAEGCPAAK